MREHSRSNRSKSAPQPATPPIDWPAPLPAMANRLYLGTSSWSFPGWAKLIWADTYSEQQLAREGLRAYAQHPMLRTVSLDRSFYAPLPVEQYRRYAEQVPDDFSFVVKAPAAVTDPLRRDRLGRGRELNPSHLDAQHALEQFITPCIGGLGAKAGVLVFQFSPLPTEWLAQTREWIDRLGRFLAALPRRLDNPSHSTPIRYAIELRDSALLTPRLIHTLDANDAHYCLALHDRMPSVQRQLRALDSFSHPQPLIVRWTLHEGYRYESTREAWAPFDRLRDEDVHTRAALVERIVTQLAIDQPSWIIANNKAEGCAPLSLLRIAQALAVRLAPPPVNPHTTPP